MTAENCSFLVVEDNDLDVEKLQRGLSKLNLPNPVVRAKDGYEALDILRGADGGETLHAPYVILLDLNMPKMGGVEFLDELRADDALSSAPVFVLTTSDHQRDVDEAYRHNVCGYIVKPVRGEQMRNALDILNGYWNLCELPYLGNRRDWN